MLWVSNNPYPINEGSKKIAMLILKFDMKLALKSIVLKLGGIFTLSSIKILYPSKSHNYLYGYIIA
jgi:hypothetical protein